MPIDSYTKLLIESELSGTADYCLDFDGSDDYVGTSAVTFPQGTDLSNYTVGCWFKPTDLSIQRDIFCQSTERVAGGLQYIGSFRLFINTNGTIGLQYQVSFNSKDGNHYITSTDSVLLNKWNHVLVARNSTNYKIFLNGKKVYDGGVGAAKFNALGGPKPINVRIGRWDPTYNFQGLISQVGMWQNDTLTEAEALELYSNPNADWSSDFGNYASSGSLVGYWRLDEGTGTSCEDLAGTNDGTLTNMDQNTDWINEAKLTHQLFEDSSSSAHTITKNGNIYHTTDQAKFGSYSAYFDGAVGTYLSLDNSNDWDLGSSDWTMETWVRFTDITSENYSDIISRFAGAGTRSYTWRCNHLNDTMQFVYSTDGTNIAGNHESSVVNITTDVWYHFCTERNGNTITFYLDGVSKGTADCTGATFFDSSLGLHVGKYMSTDTLHVHGYMEDIRLSVGIARYQGNFTPLQYSHGASHKFGGEINDGARILIFDESTWEVESTEERDPSTYEIGTTSGTKTIVGINTHGEVIGYGNVDPTEIT